MTADITNKPARGGSALLLSFRRFTLSPLFSVLLLLLGCLFTLLSAEVSGALTFLCILLVILVACDDIFATTTPFLLLTVLVSACYDGYGLFSPFIPLVFPTVAALLFHFIYYRAPLRMCNSFAPLLAVSIAVTLGGVGCITAEEYFAPAALYYVGGLGFGMLLIYLLLKSAMGKKRDYDVKQLLLRALYLCGLYAAFFTLLFYAERLVWMQDDLEIFGHLRLISIDNRNVYATYLLLGLPAPLYHAAKGKWWHMSAALLMLLALMLSGSRGGLLVGLALFAVCLIYLFRRNKKHRLGYGIFFGLLAVAGLCSLGFLLKFYSFRFEGGFIIGNEPRVLLLKRAVSDFLNNPIFGVGLGYTGNGDIYSPKAGAMNWYHMLVPQIVAGLGLTGTFAFLFLFWRRAKLMRAHKAPLSRALSLSYLGLFLMSQVNPGEFCPMPYALLGMMIFLLLEEESEKGQEEQHRTHQKALSTLLGNGLFAQNAPLPENIALEAVLQLAEAHMVFGVVGDALSLLPEDALSTESLLELQDKTVTLLRQNAALAAERGALCACLREMDIPAVILKGDSVARLYPAPDLRVAGDIDCLVPKDAIPAICAQLIKKGYTLCQKQGEHHTVLKKGLVTIELHRTVSGVPRGIAGDKLNTYLSSILTDAEEATVMGEVLPVPHDFHQALVLLLHMQQHMREGGLGLRQLSDWALFVTKELKPSTLPRLKMALADVGLLTFAATVTLAVMAHLGAPLDENPFGHAEPALANALFDDIMASGNFGHANAAYAGSAILTLEGSEEGKSSFKTALSRVADKCKREWPTAKQHPALLTILVPFWVLRRMLSHPVRPLAMLQSAQQRAGLYRQLNLFENEQHEQPQAKEK